MLDKTEMSMLLNEAADGIKAIYVSHIMEKILFGSYARDDVTKGSDVDIAVILDLTRGKE